MRAIGKRNTAAPKRLSHVFAIRTGSVLLSEFAGRPAGPDAHHANDKEYCRPDAIGENLITDCWSWTQSLRPVTGFFRRQLWPTRGSCFVGSHGPTTILWIHILSANLSYWQRSRK